MWSLIFGDYCAQMWHYLQEKQDQNQVCPGKINHRVVKELKTLPQFLNYLGGFSLEKRRLGDLCGDYHFKS